MRDASFLDADEIRAASFVRHVEIHDTLASTNDRARELAADAHVDLPVLVVARQQTAGRGRGQHSWWSADGALTFSILFDTASIGGHAKSLPQLSLTTAVAICDALGNVVSKDNHPTVDVSPTASERVGIKWPNDIILDGGKVCGILIESPGGASPAKDRLIIGIGINVNNSWRSAPREAGANGIAVCDSTSTPHNLQAVLTKTLNAIAVRAKQLANGDPRLPEAWQELCWLTGQRVEGKSNGVWIDGICQGIAADGALVVENVFGTHRLTSGSVRMK
jgi:BirA family biotin operon repressor/biotin-[acetyl-CoA-carboxylase] ligase